MNSDQNENENGRKGNLTHVVVVIVALSIIAIGILLANSSFDLTGFVIKLHGG